MSAEKEDKASAATKYESIVLTLTQKDAASVEPLVFPVRSIRFTASESTIQIGRSSKTVSKGLCPAENNAYFDSPVMSRAHAEMKADLNEGSIYLKDLGSLHGTSINKTTLQKNSAVSLKAGDSICFGIHVARGLEVFSPATVLVEFVPHAMKPTAALSRAYRAPEPNDELSDGGSECDCSSSEYHSDVGDSSGDKDEESDNAAMDNVPHTPSNRDRESALSASPVSENTNENNDAIIERPVVVTSLFEETVGQSPEDMMSYGEAESISDSSDADAVELNYSEDDTAGPIGPDGDNDDADLEDSEEEDEEGVDDDSSQDDSDGSQDLDADDFDDMNDDGSDFLSAEISRFGSTAAKPTVSTTVVHETAVSVATDFYSLNSHWTPPFISSATPFDGDEAPKDNVLNTTDVPMEEADVADVSADVDALPHNGTPLNMTKKCNISSILNPSPPPSSPTRDASVNATTICIAPMEPVDVAITSTSHQDQIHAIRAVNVTCQERETTCAEIVESETVLATVLSQNCFRASPDAPVLADVAFSEFSKSIDTSALLQSGEAFLCSSLKEPMRSSDIMEDDEGDAMSSAAVFNLYKKKKDTNEKKRKADEMLAEPADICETSNVASAGLSSNSLSTKVPGITKPATEAPSKRQATAAAMQSNRRIKGAMWAVAEKIGIAALGGAVVLGSLIYTAPSL